MIKVPILTYHAFNITGASYKENDHVALASDLRTLQRLGLKVVSLYDIATHLINGTLSTIHGCVGISFDDGTDFDALDLIHPLHGTQRSMFGILADFQQETGTTVTATAFVIASKMARKQIAARDLFGKDWMRDSWWQPAQTSNLVHIGNHSWDHQHPAVPNPETGQPKSGRFDQITNFDEADKQIRKARDYIYAVAPGPSSALFAYPYGQTSDYLTEVYFPEHGEAGGSIAAFTCEPTAVVSSSNRWAIPRYVCGLHWHSSQSFEQLFR